MRSSRPRLDDPAGAIALAVLGHAQAEGYRGYNKHDALNSPILRALLGHGRWPRMLAIQGVMRFPVNLRPLLLVPKTWNPKGLSLFVRGLLDLHAVSGDGTFFAEAVKLGELLLELRDPLPDGSAGWGYHYPWQDPGFYAPPRTPNAVVTCFVCESLLDLHAASGDRRYLEAVSGAAAFLLGRLPRLLETADELCVGYMPMPMQMRVMDVSILIGALLARLGRVTGDASRAADAARLVRFVVNRQTAEGAWFYTDPPGASHLKHDNYHTGFILDALDSYRRHTGATGPDPAYVRGLDFYAQRLFNADGAPRWMSDQDFPHDVHGAAQGIVTFARHRAEYPGLADRIADWAIRTLYSGAGTFYYQQHRLYTVRTSLLRWCNAWMFRGLTALVRARAGQGAQP